MAMFTPHNTAQPEEIGRTVLMPGDPKRSRFIAENFLENAQLINDIRGMQGYTGMYKGTKITTMAHGIGIPSVGLYAYEYFKFYDVPTIIRVGSVGSIQPDVHTKEMIIADTAYTDSNFPIHLGFAEDYLAKATPELVQMAEEIAAANGVKYHKGPVLTQELYYSQEEGLIEAWQKKGALGFEMEAACLYAHADLLNKKALTLLTVSNNILTGEEMDPADRETSFTEMLETALEIAVRLDK